jgi:ribosomal protein S18
MATTIGKQYTCNTISFKLFCRFCEDICNAKYEKKISMLKKFIEKYRGKIEESDDINIVRQFGT